MSFGSHQQRGIPHRRAPAGYDFDLSEGVFFGLEASARQAVRRQLRAWCWGATASRRDAQRQEPLLRDRRLHRPDLQRLRRSHIVGAGADIGLTDNLYGKVEYRHFFLDGRTDSNVVAVERGRAFPSLRARRASIGGGPIVRAAPFSKKEFSALGAVSARVQGSRSHKHERSSLPSSPLSRRSLRPPRLPPTISALESARRHVVRRQPERGSHPRRRRGLRLRPQREARSSASRLRPTRSSSTIRAWSWAAPRASA